MNTPKISIITVCYNMEKYIEQTIQSVINQGYSNLEYIIVDGGSTDSTMEIINKYNNQIARIICEPDESMYDAINKGIEASSGEIVAWLNADDSYFPWTLKTVAQAFSTNPDVNWIGGMHAFLDEDRFLTNIFTHAAAKPQKAIVNGWFREGVYGSLLQEGMFWRRNLYFKSGGLDMTYKYAGDFELWTRFALHSDLVTIAIPLGAFMRRSSGLSIGSIETYRNEIKRACLGKKKYPSLLWYISGHNIYVHLLRLFSFRKSRLFYYSYPLKCFHVKKVFRSVSSNSLSEMRYENIFKSFD